MSTKFILHGGYASHINTENDLFFKEILKSAPLNPRVLLVYFALTPDQIPAKHPIVVNQFERNKEDKQIEFTIAQENIFSEQIKKADIVYLRGGKTLQLIEKLKTYSELENLIEGKTIAGESAGAYALATLFYSKTEGGVFDGLGFVPVKLICHYVGENSEKLPDTPRIETLLLPDYIYKVFYKNHP